MAKGASKSAVRKLECREVSSVNTDELESALMRAELRVLKIQTKLHRWAPRTRDGACGEPAASTRRTAGSGGGSGRRTGRKAGTAPRVDLTVLDAELTTRWLRWFTSRPAPMSGSWKATSKACFDEISHSALMDRVRKRIGDKRVLAPVTAFLHAGIRAEHGGSPE